MSWHEIAQSGAGVEALSTKQCKALAALNTSTSVAEAAEAAGVGQRTLWRWLASDPGFQEAYREQRRALLDGALGLLQSSLYEALEALVEAVRNGDRNQRIRAAGMIMEHALRGVQMDVEDRVSALESKKNGRHR